MTRVARPRGKKAERASQSPVGKLKKPYPVWLVTAAAFVLPGSGQVLNGNAIRGIVMQFFMLLLGFITWEVSTPDTSFVGRIAGGIAVYVISVIDAHNVARRRVAAWERIVATGGLDKEATKPTSQSAKPPSAHPKPPAAGGPAR
ncbi:MAG TPA: hypothetical protein VJ787_08925, partial [Thermoleophilia bacterium]|nr:hypothetical protein [Thermoleophilia bacterium]